MFANFIYFILALLIYSTHPPADAPGLPPLESLLAASILIVGFSLFCRRQFGNIAVHAAQGSHERADQRFSTVNTRLSILSLVIFGVLIHGLSLPAFFRGIRILDVIPTLLALAFMGVFTGLLSIVWFHAWLVHRQLYDPGSDRGEYVVSNLRFSIPIIIPWVLISGISDLIFALPWEWPKRILASTGGEVAYFLIFLVLASVFAPVLVQRFWGCRPLEPGFYRHRIEQLCRRAGVQYRNILYWPIFGGRMITAGVMGLVHRFRYILVTESLLGSLTPEEVDTVIAHEIGHVKHNHLVYYLVFIAGFMMITYAGFDLVIWMILSIPPVFRLITDFEFNPSTVVSTAFSVVFLSAFLIYFRFIFGYFIRNFERQADAYVYRFFDSARPMISTFEKIAIASGQSADNPNWHHFSLRERIRFLLKCELDRKWIRRHDRKVRRSLAVFFVGMVLVGYAAYQFNFGSARTAVGGHFLERILMKEIELKPGDPQLYSLLGDLRYSQNDPEGAMDAYEKSLSLEPDNAQILNNLAWLLATTETDGLKNPRRALRLAMQSVALDPSAHALDTLAESYFVNNDVESAVAAAQMALEKATENRSYYTEQLERFRKALQDGRRAI
ncbi:MAG: M48 family metalloprotease [Desulfobacterales bacterium]